jgi:hypothetical protein
VIGVELAAHQFDVVDTILNGVVDGLQIEASSSRRTGGAGELGADDSHRRAKTETLRILLEPSLEPPFIKAQLA